MGKETVLFIEKIEQEAQAFSEGGNFYNAAL